MSSGTIRNSNLCDVDYCAWPAKLRYEPWSVIDVSALASGVSLPWQATKFLPGHTLDGNSCEKILRSTSFLFFRFLIKMLAFTLTRPISQIRWRIEYLIPTNDVIVFLLHWNLTQKYSQVLIQKQWLFVRWLTFGGHLIRAYSIFQAWAGLD